MEFRTDQQLCSLKKWSVIRFLFKRSFFFRAEGLSAKSLIKVKGNLYSPSDWISFLINLWSYSHFSWKISLKCRHTLNVQKRQHFLLLISHRKMTDHQLGSCDDFLYVCVCPELTKTPKSQFFPGNNKLHS